MQQGKPAYSHVVTVNGPGKTDLCRRAAGARRYGNSSAGRHAGPDGADLQEPRFLPQAAGSELGGRGQDQHFVTDYPEFSKHSDVRMRLYRGRLPDQHTVQISRSPTPTRWSRSS